MDILKIIFVIFLLSFSLGEIVRFDLGNSFFVKLSDFIAVILIVTWAVLPRAHCRGTRMTGSILLFIVVALVSLLVNIKHLSNSELIVSLSYLARWVLYASLYYVITSFSFEFKKKILYILLVSGALFVLFGFIQYFFYSNLRNLYYLGWDDHMYRLFSTFLDPNFAGAFFVLYLIFLSGIFLYFLNNKQKNLIILTIVISLLTLVATYLTFSRSALIMLFVSSLTFFVLIKRIKFTVVLIVVSAAFLLLSSKNFHIENINPLRIASSQARLDSSKTSIQIIKDNPFLGVGFNAYRYAQIRYGFRHGEGAIKSHADAGTDNSFLFVLGTTGFIGLLSFLYLLFVILKRAYINYSVFKKKHIRNIMSIIVIASFVGIIINSFFINSLFYSFNMMWLWIIVGLHDSNRG